MSFFTEEPKYLTPDKQQNDAIKKNTYEIKTNHNYYLILKLVLYYRILRLQWKIPSVTSKAILHNNIQYTV